MLPTCTLPVWSMSCSSAEVRVMPICADATGSRLTCTMGEGMSKSVCTHSSSGILRISSMSICAAFCMESVLLP